MDRSTLRRIEDKTQVNYSTKWKQAQKYADHIPSPIDNFRKNKAHASKILLLDDKYIRVRGNSICVHIAHDTGIGVIHYWIDETEDKIAYHYMLRQLRESGYEPICMVSDEHSALVSLIRELGIAHQLFLFHLLQSLKQRLTNKKGIFVDMSPKYSVMYTRIKGILKARTIETMVIRLERFRKLVPFWNTARQKQVLRWFWRILPNATIGLSFKEKVPNTSNLLENINGQIEQRIKTFRGAKSEESVNKILKILFYFRKYK